MYSTLDCASSLVNCEFQSCPHEWEEVPCLLELRNTSLKCAQSRETECGKKYLLDLANGNEKVAVNIACEKIVKDHPDSCPVTSLWYTGIECPFGKKNNEGCSKQEKINCGKEHSTHLSE